MYITESVMGMPRAPLQHLIQTTVERIEKILFVAVEPSSQTGTFCAVSTKSRPSLKLRRRSPRLRGQLVQMIQERLGLQARKLNGGEIERGRIQTALA